MKTSVAAIAAISVLFVTACGDKKAASKENFKTAIQAYFDSKPGACVGLPDKQMPFKVESGGFRVSRIDQADALVEAGLLSKRETEVPSTGYFGPNKMVPGVEYSLTDEGAKQVVKSAGSDFDKRDGFCAGKYQVVEVINFTDPAEAYGQKLSQANYRYKVESPPAWAKLPRMQAVFPQLAKDMKDDPADKAVLVSTSEGWLHERVFKGKGN
ncbi:MULTISPECIES: hypothetical protein [unclassified Variovorax]|uniref:hypothetical protein n=1 Tax=unclassified Variovorax TaxID=663243 RepID=UPI001BD2A32B|nr:MULTISPECIES: hypothetical protein [unclassified Variovorax]